jgi:hypothetical protein
MTRSSAAPQGKLLGRCLSAVPGAVRQRNQAMPNRLKTGILIPSRMTPKTRAAANSPEQSSNENVRYGREHEPCRWTESPHPAVGSEGVDFGLTSADDGDYTER